MTFEITFFSDTTHSNVQRTEEWQMQRMIWVLVVLWWLHLNPTGLLSPKLSRA